MIANGFMDAPAPRRNSVARPTSPLKAPVPWTQATVKDLGLPQAITVNEDRPLRECVTVCEKGGFDQLPVVKGSGKAVGLITLGMLLPFLLDILLTKSFFFSHTLPPPVARPIISFRQHTV